MMIKQGSQLICLECSEVAFIATRDIQEQEPIISSSISFGDGSDISFGSLIACYKCDSKEIVNRIKFSHNWRKDK